jgi:hypothetical protein
VVPHVIVHEAVVFGSVADLSAKDEIVSAKFNALANAFTPVAV